MGTSLPEPVANTVNFLAFRILHYDTLALFTLIMGDALRHESACRFCISALQWISVNSLYGLARHAASGLE
jgi:hypothetical protein